MAYQYQDQQPHAYIIPVAIDPYPSVQANVIQNSMTEIDQATPQRISGNSSKFSPHTSQYNSGYWYSSSSHDLRASISTALKT